MAQQLYGSLTTIAGNYTSQAQVGNTSVICFGAETRTLIDDMETVANWAAGSLTIADDAVLFKQGAESMKFTAFNAVTDHADRDITLVDYSDFTGFEIWAWCDYPSGQLALQFEDTSTRTATVQFSPVLTWTKGNLSAIACKQWVRKSFLTQEFKLSDAAFAWGHVRYIRILTKEVTNTTQYNVDAIYGVGGSNLKFWWDGSAPQCYPLRIGRPDTNTAGTSATEGAAGNVDVGDHYYKICYVNKTIDPEQRGPLSESFTDEVTANAKIVDLANIPDPGSATDITHIHIFRTDINGSATLGPYYFCAEIARGTTTYADNIADATLRGREQLLDRYVQNSDEVPDVAVCVAASNRMFYLCDPNNPRRVWWSEYGKPCEMYGDNYFDLRGSGNDKITGGVNLNNVLYVTEGRTVWRFGNLGAKPAAWTIGDLETGVGCAGHRTIQSIGLGDADRPLACWLSDYPLNVYAFDGMKCYPIGDAIVPKLKAMSHLLRPYCPSAIDGENQRYILGVATAGVTDHWDKAYAYDFQLTRKRGKKTWLPWDWRTFSALGVVTAGDEAYVIEGTDAGYVFEHTDASIADGVNRLGTDARGGLAGTINAVTGTVFEILRTSALSAETADIYNGMYAYCDAGTGSGSWGLITDSADGGSAGALGRYLDLTIPSWSSTTPVATDTVLIAPIAWEWKSKVFDFVHETQFNTLHLFFKDTSANTFDVEWFINRSSTALATAVEVVPSSTEMDVGINCHARQIQVKLSCVTVAPDIRLSKIGFSYIHRSEHD